MKINESVRTNSGDTCRIAALEHQGIVLQQDFLVGGDIKRGALVELMPQYQSITLGIYAVYASRKHMPLKLRRMLHFLIESFRSPSWQ